MRPSIPPYRVPCDRLSYAEFVSQSRVGYLTCRVERAHPSDLCLRELGPVDLFASCNKSYFDGVPDVLFVRQQFQIPDAVVRFVPVNVVDLQPVRGSEEYTRYDGVYLDGLPALSVTECDNRIPLHIWTRCEDATDLGTTSQSNTFDSSVIADFVDSIPSDDRSPSFFHGADHNLIGVGV